MPDETQSYADFSIIHRYLEQQRLHEEALAKKDDRVRELEYQLQDAQAENERRQQTIARLTGQLNDLKAGLAEREQEVERQRQQIVNLQQRVGELQREIAGKGRR